MRPTSVTMSLAKDEASRLDPDTASGSTLHESVGSIPAWVSDDKQRNTLPGFRGDKLLNRRAIITAVFNLVVYLTVSIAVMRALEPGWTFIDAAYFCLAVMSTVGCGHSLRVSNAACPPHTHTHATSAPE